MKPALKISEVILHLRCGWIIKGASLIGTRYYITDGFKSEYVRPQIVDSLERKGVIRPNTELHARDPIRREYTYALNDIIPAQP